MVSHRILILKFFACATIAMIALTTPASARVIPADPKTYLTLLGTLQPGDTLMLEAGIYDEPGQPPGLPILGLHGRSDAPITITGPDSGPKALLLGRATHNTVRIADSSHVVVKNLEIDGRDLGGDGVNGQGPSHHVTLENLTIRGVGAAQGVVGISTNRAPAWNWTIRGNVIVGAGTGMYLGNSDGGNPFVAGVIERNLVYDTIGYNVQIKHQREWPPSVDLPRRRTTTIIRHNVFGKGANSAIGRLARPNLLVGDVPRTGDGSANGYEIYGNVFLHNPTEALFQGEGNLAVYANLFVNDHGPAIVIQPHNGVVRDVQVFANTVVASGDGIVIRGGAPAFVQRADVNAVFSPAPIVAPNQLANIVGSYTEAPRHLVRPLGTDGTRDFSPRGRALRGPPIDVGEWRQFSEWDRDLDAAPRDWRVRGAYSHELGRSAWLPKLRMKPCRRLRAKAATSLDCASR